MDHAAPFCTTHAPAIVLALAAALYVHLRQECAAGLSALTHGALEKRARGLRRPAFVVPTSQNCYDSHGMPFRCSLQTRPPDRAGLFAQGFVALLELLDDPDILRALLLTLAAFHA